MPIKNRFIAPKQTIKSNLPHLSNNSHSQVTLTHLTTNYGSGGRMQLFLVLNSSVVMETGEKEKESEFMNSLEKFPWICIRAIYYFSSCDIFRCEISAKIFPPSVSVGGGPDGLNFSFLPSASVSSFLPSSFLIIMRGILYF